MIISVPIDLWQDSLGPGPRRALLTRWLKATSVADLAPVKGLRRARAYLCVRIIILVRLLQTKYRLVAEGEDTKYIRVDIQSPCMVARARYLHTAQ